VLAAKDAVAREVEHELVAGATRQSTSASPWRNAALLAQAWNATGLVTSQQPSVWSVSTSTPWWRRGAGLQFGPVAEFTTKAMRRGGLSLMFADDRNGGVTLLRELPDLAMASSLVRSLASTNVAPCH